MLPKVFQAQHRRPSDGDWTEIVKKDLNDFEISLTFEQIKNVKQDAFKKKVLEACRKYTFKQLLFQQQKRRNKSKNSKGNKINYKNFELQKYLRSDKISAKDAKLLFMIRTNMSDVRYNYRHKYTKSNNNISFI